MSFGPWAMDHGTQLLGLIFKKLLKLDTMRAWRLALVACGLQLGAWRLGLVTFFR
jgi:hypothetical protein